MKKICKKMIGFCIVCSLILVMAIPAGNVKALEKPESPQDVFRIAKEKKESRARKTEPEEWNQPEIKAYRFDSLMDTLKYMLTGGIKYYNENFFQSSRKVKVTIVEDGTLFLTAAEENEGKIALYDADMKFLRNITEDEDFIKVNGKAGESYYVEFPSNTKEAMIMTYVWKDSFTTLKTSEVLLQKGEGKPTYHPFTLKKRSYALIGISPLAEDGGNTTAYIEKKVKGKWVIIGKKYHTIPEDSEACVYGLKAGSYRLVLNAKTNQASTVMYIKHSVKKNVTYRKTKAKNIKVGKSKDNIYTTGEKASRWYKMTVSSTKKQRKIKFTGESDNGKFKFSIYRAGKKKPIKTKKISSGNYYSYKLPKKKGTYYVKVSKVGKRTNGYYDIEFK